MEPRNRRDDFSTRIKEMLAKRAGYRCSNPSCRASTVGAEPSAPDKALYAGRAAHICAASPLGPRYDPNQSSAERSDIQNGIHLCIACADRVDQNGGMSVTADDLRKWKREREEETIKEWSRPASPGATDVRGVIYAWLQGNTADAPGKSHRTIQQISIGTRLTEDEVQAACRSDMRMFPSQKQPGSWSIFRAEPESVYERRGVRAF
jgi:hypothetical protein